MSEEHHCCHDSEGNPSVRQNLQEMDFERGLWGAAVNNDEDDIMRLLANGSDPSAQDNYGYTPLHYASRKGNINIVKKLLEAGSDVNITTKSGKATPLHRAAAQGHERIVCMLLQAGADTLKVDADGETALHKAVIGKYQPVVELLLNTNPHNREIKDNKGRKPQDLLTENMSMEFKQLFK